MALEAVSDTQQEPIDKPKTYDAMSALQLARIENEQALADLQKSLDYRQNMPIDPVWLAASRGFFKPTKTGSFFESLGNVGDTVSTALEDEFKRKQETAKLKTELSGKRLALAQQLAAAEDWNRMVGGQGYVAPQTNAAPAPIGSSAPSGATEGAVSAPSGATAAAETQLAPRDVAALSNPTAPTPSFSQFQTIPTITDRDIARAFNISPEHGTKLETLAKMQQEAIKVRNGQLISTPSGLFDVATGKYVPGELANHFTEITLPGTNETRKVSFEVAQGLSAAIAQRDKARRAGNPNADKIVMDYMDSQGIPYRTTTERTKAGQETTRFESPDEAAERKQREEARGSGRKEFATKTAADSAAEEKSIVAQAKQSHSITQNANSLMDLMSKPEYKNAWGYFSDASLKSALVNFVKEGVQVGNINVGVPALASSLKQAGMNDQQIAAATRAAQIYGELRVQIARRDLAGEGSISDGERRLVSDISGGVDMPLKSAMASAELMKYRAEFDRHQASAYHDWREKNPDAPTGKFYSSDEYGRLQNSYDKTMNQLSQKYFPSASGNIPTQSENIPSAAPQNKPVERQAQSARPPEKIIRNTLKQGVVTKFANGTYWTLDANSSPIETDSTGTPLRK